jgi:hypothetical protein
MSGRQRSSPNRTDLDSILTCEASRGPWIVLQIRLCRLSHTNCNYFDFSLAGLASSLAPAFV